MTSNPDALLKQALCILRMSCPPTQEIGANISEGEGRRGDQGELGIERKNKKFTL